MDNKIVSSKENLLFKEVKKLKDKKYREKNKRFLAEGIKFLQKDKSKVELILGDISKREEINKIEYITSEEKFKIVFFDEKLFHEISSQENSQGIVIIYKIIENNIEKIGDNVIVLDRVQDPGNMGTLIRTIDAAGFKDVILTKGCVDIYNEKTVRASMGSLLGLSYYFMEEDELIDFLKKEKYKTVSAALTNNSIFYNEMKVSKKNALVLGNEGNGISENILNNSDEILKIPIYGGAESLNVSIAGGILLYKLRELLSCG